MTTAELRDILSQDLRDQMDSPPSDVRQPAWYLEFTDMDGPKIQRGSVLVKRAWNSACSGPGQAAFYDQRGFGFNVRVVRVFASFDDAAMEAVRLTQDRLDMWEYRLEKIKSMAEERGVS